MKKNLSIKNAFESEVVDEVVDFVIPQFVSSQEEAVLQEAAKKIAQAFNISKCFDDVLSDGSRSLEAEVVESWSCNVHLLIDKTWVETDDAFFKAETVKALDMMTGKLTDIFCERRESYLRNFEQFCALLQNIIRLLFGKEAEMDSLVEYVLRMEPNFGLFCYYLEALNGMRELSEFKARLAMGLAIVFLAEF